MSNCKGVSNVVGGLLGDCPTPDIGCLPITTGEPDFTPEQDELPLAFDPISLSLWVWRCNAGPWVELPHTDLCDIAIGDIEAIQNACDNIWIPITFNEDGDCCGDGCSETRVTLESLALQIKECAEIKHLCELPDIPDGKVGVANEVKLAACVDGEAGLINQPDVICEYTQLGEQTTQSLIQSDDVWLAACTEGDQESLVNPRYFIPQICSLPDAEEEDITGATTLRMAVCIDNVPYQMPIPTICGFAPMTNAQRDAAASVQLAACVDGEQRLINQFSLCSLPTSNQQSVDDATSVGVAACVDGVDTLIPYFEEFTVCGLTQIPEQEAQALQVSDDLLIAMCSEGTNDVLVNPNHLILNMCNIPQIEEEDFNNANSRWVAGCFDNESVLVPYPTEICELPVLNQAAVDAATTVLLGACVDGVNSQIPVPIEYAICGLEHINDAVVDAATSVTLGACVDGVDQRINLPPTICEVQEITYNAMLAGTDVTMAGCVDGESVRFPLPLTVCEFPQVNQTDIDNGTEVNIAMCIDGVEVLAPWTPHTPTICELPVLNQVDVDAATTVTLGACVDGVNSQIPLPDTNEFSICGLTQIPEQTAQTLQLNNDLLIAMCSEGTDDVLVNPNHLIHNMCNIPQIEEEDFNNASSRWIAGCFDNESVLVPYPTAGTALCALPSIDQVAVNAATSVELAACVDGVENLIPLPPNVCDLPVIDQATVDAATVVTIAACVDGEERLIPRCCHEPVLLRSTADVAVGACWTYISGDGKLVDSREPHFHGAVSMPNTFSFTNPTNMTGTLTIQAKLWANRYYDNLNPLTSGRIPARALFMLGKSADMALFPLDETTPGNANALLNTPFGLTDLDVGMGELPTEDRYKFWGSWTELIGGGVANGFDSQPAAEVAHDVDHVFRLNPGQTIEFQSVVAIGYDREVAVGEVENGWAGAKIRLMFEGQNEIL